MNKVIVILALFLMLAVAVFGIVVSDEIVPLAEMAQAQQNDPVQQAMAVHTAVNDNGRAQGAFWVLLVLFAVSLIAILLHVRTGYLKQARLWLRERRKGNDKKRPSPRLRVLPPTPETRPSRQPPPPPQLEEGSWLES